MRRCERNGSRIGIGASVGSVRMWEVSVIVVWSAKLRHRCEVSTTTAPTPRVSIMNGAGKMSATTASTPRVSILDGGGKSGRSTTAVVVRCDGMVGTRSDITMVVHVVGMVLFTIIVILMRGNI